MIQDSSGPDRLDILTEQVGRLTEVLTVGFQDLKSISERQEQNISRLEADVSRLIGIVETLLELQRSQ